MLWLELWLPTGVIIIGVYPIVNAFRYTIVRSLYWRIKAILADFVRIPPN
eukprot:COSAG01_NODE_6906_length_3444_cov_8.863677_7_plen_49_part_01